MVLTIHNGARYSRKVIACVGEGMEKNIAARFTNTDYLKPPTFPSFFFNSIKMILWKFLSILFSK